MPPLPPMEDEFADLIPLFAEESRERLDRLALCLPRLAADPQAAVEARRELHTLKGAGRMMRLDAFAELCHAAEELLHGQRPGELATAGLVPILMRALDRLSAMVEEAAGGAAKPAPDAELLALLATALPARPAMPASQASPAASPAPPGIPASPAPPGIPASPAPPGIPAAAPPTRPARGGRTMMATEVRVDAAALDMVAERATEVRILALAARPLAERLHELARLAEEGVREPQPGQALAVLATMLRRTAVDLEGSQRRLLHAAEGQLERMLKLQLQPLRGSLLALARYARELGRSLKREIEVVVEGEDTRLDRRIARELEEALLHLVRNAVDHGIESPEVREARGKPRAGRLLLRASGTANRVRLEIADDGAGIDSKRVRQQAVAAGLLDAAAAAAMERDDLLRLLFAPGFSTRKRVSEVSGRGVGLDVVATAASRAGGEVTVSSVARHGTTVALEVPLARRGEHVLLLQVGALRLALPSAVVRRATRLDAGAVVERDGRTLARVGERLVPFVPLGRLYGQAPAHGGAQLLLEGQVSGQPLAVVVDDVLREQEVLVRPLTRTVATDRLLEGVALLTSGEPVGVLSPTVLAQREHLRAAPVAAPEALQARLRVLLVDDSLVTREMERRLLEDAGFEVAVAGDAQEALARLGGETFDCVVTDIEMPGMDGFELTAQLRALEHFTQMPIVVVSTRDRPEDRLRGLKAGADAYLTKQGLDAGELVQLVRRLGGRH
jgi:two-component system chemotaxis sensor kinase CheA